MLPLQKSNANQQTLRKPPEETDQYSSKHMQSENLGKQKQHTRIIFRQWNNALATCYALCYSYPVGRPEMVVRAPGVP